MTKLQTIFIHEIGHHIANELNTRLFGFDRRTESILIYPSNVGEFFDGKTIISNTNTEQYQVENTPLEYIRIFYGCLFECLLREIKITQCLCGIATENDIKNNLCKGRADYHQMARMMLNRNIQGKYDWWRYLTVEYFEFMKSKSDNFKIIFELKAQDFILKENTDCYEIDLNRLNLAIEPFFTVHQEDFKVAVKELRKLHMRY